MADSNVRSIMLLIITIALAVLYFMAGGSKFVGMQPTWAVNFDLWGYPGWFLYLVGAVEFIGAALLLVPSIAIFGSMALGTIMFGAFWSHIASGEYLGSIVAGVLFVLLVFLGRLRVGAFLTRFPFQ